MKRTELKRKTPLVSRVGLSSRTELRAGKPMRQRSKRTEKLYRDARRALVAALLEARPICECCQQARSTEIHEVLSRGRGGSITDPDNCRALCHDCHVHVTENPAWAEANGWAVSQYGGAA